MDWPFNLKGLPVLSAGDKITVVTIAYSVIKKDDGDHCAWCDQLNPTNEHIEDHERNGDV